MSNAGIPINKSPDCKLQSQSRSGRDTAALSLLAAHRMNFDPARDLQSSRTPFTVAQTVLGSSHGPLCTSAQPAWLSSPALDAKQKLSSSLPPFATYGARVRKRDNAILSLLNRQDNDNWVQNQKLRMRGFKKLQNCTVPQQTKLKLISKWSRKQVTILLLEILGVFT